MGIPITLIVLLVVFSPTTSSKLASSPTPISGADTPNVDAYQLLYINNVKPYVLSDHHTPLPPPFHRRHRHHHHHQINGGGRKEAKKKNNGPAVKADTWPNRFSTSRHVVGPRPFYVMLPKGYVPPSGSSRCHNVYPTTFGDDHHFECRYFPNHLKP